MNSVKASLSLEWETLLMSNSVLTSHWMQLHGDDRPWPHEDYVIDFVPLFKAASQLPAFRSADCQHKLWALETIYKNNYLLSTQCQKFMLEPLL